MSPVDATESGEDARTTWSEPRAQLFDAVRPGGENGRSAILMSILQVRCCCRRSSAKPQGNQRVMATESQERRPVPRLSFLRLPP